ncbi:FAD-binding domain-containing protein [Thozetella sp. PMI_491]|nr:FAD-binding domain-containing protein [Thozetella sp. PMI_491]
MHLPWNQASLYVLSFSSLAGRRALAKTETPLNCKCSPTDSCWPSDLAFDTLNNTVSGQLIRAVPPAAVCYPDQPNYNLSACQAVWSSWNSSAWHAADPVSIDWPWFANNSCPPINSDGISITGDPDAGQNGCTIGGYPVYVLNATEPTQIQTVVKFANRHNLRLNIKATGHSFQGRSTAYGSISIWTHNYRGAEWHDNFQADGCRATHTTQMAVTLAAGEHVKDAYQFTSQYNAIVVAGSDENVGIMGWFQGGGHGWLSSSYGMGVDNVLQVKMVTPTGEYLTANACQNRDLFWAVRGGGGGTWGVVTEVTMKAYPSPRTTTHSFTLVASSNSSASTFFDIAAGIFSEFPRLKDGGFQGFMYIYPPGYAAAGWVFTWTLNLYNKPNGTAQKLFTPIAKLLDPLNGTVLSYKTSTKHASSFWGMWGAAEDTQPVAWISPAMGSRLLPGSAVTDQKRLSSVLTNMSMPALGGSVVLIQSLFIANSDRRNESASVSMNEAWRDAVTHMIVLEGFPDWEDYIQAQPTLNRITYDRVGLLRELAPNSGAYVNEADAFDPNWQYDFWRDNYPRLRAIKQKYDPNSVLWCKSCVGSEEWMELDPRSGKLCKAEWAKKSKF